jgi:undecaprenyl diphosphate synthase
MAEQKTCRHLAIIMDGNGRWAKAQGKPRVAGHQEGMENVRRIALAASAMGVKVLTLYAFSTENWARPKQEVAFLMNLPVRFFNHYMPMLMENQIKVNIMGFMDRLPQKTLAVVEKAQEQTKNNTGMVLNFAFNYGSRAEITAACRKLAARCAAGELEPAAITEDMISQELMTGKFGDLANPDLLIRTSGEQRLSNFLLWQLAYSEFYFTDKYWPDFDKADLAAAISAFEKRDRRFGKI